MRFTSEAPPAAEMVSSSNNQVLKKILHLLCICPYLGVLLPNALASKKQKAASKHQGYYKLRIN